MLIWSVKGSRVKSFLKIASRYCRWKKFQQKLKGSVNKDRSMSYMYISTYPTTLLRRASSVVFEER